MRSDGRWAMNSMAMSLATLILSGVKSLASMVVDTSIASTMSMPSVSTVSVSEDERGRATATIIRQRAAVLNANGRCRITASGEKPACLHGRTVDTRMCGLRSESSRYT